MFRSVCQYLLMAAIIGACVCPAVAADWKVVAGDDWCDDSRWDSRYCEIRDAIPGLVSTVWFTPSLPGKYEIACSQLCGSQILAGLEFVPSHPYLFQRSRPYMAMNRAE